MKTKIKATHVCICLGLSLVWMMCDLGILRDLAHGYPVYLNEDSIYYIWKLVLYIVPSAVLTFILDWSYREMKKIRLQAKQEYDDWVRRNP
jgi:hypothetical protein